MDSQIRRDYEYEVRKGLCRNTKMSCFTSDLAAAERSLSESCNFQLRVFCCLVAVVICTREVARNRAACRAKKAAKALEKTIGKCRVGSCRTAPNSQRRLVFEAPVLNRNVSQAPGLFRHEQRISPRWDPRSDATRRNTASCTFAAGRPAPSPLLLVPLPLAFSCCPLAVLVLVLGDSHAGVFDATEMRGLLSEWGEPNHGFFDARKFALNPRRVLPTICPRRRDPTTGIPLTARLLKEGGEEPHYRISGRL
jgi:hypothetical protein